MFWSIALALACAPPPTIVSGAVSDDWVAFPDQAPGLVIASPTLSQAGRNFARGRTVQSVLDAAAALHAANPASVVVLGDVGKNGGGKMPPHATHRDGRTVDILMPVVDVTDAASPKAAQFPHSDADGFGYCARFDKDGRFVGTAWEGTKPVPHPSGKGPLCRDANDALPLAIDFGAIARLVRAIDTAAAAQGLRVKRVIVAPEYVEKVLGSDDGKLLDARVVSTFVRRPVWTRHDDHVHIELEPRAGGRAR
jgi:penicillin-insensitive murein endopeptidase